MSAECSDCGRDIEYPPSSWPLGECSYCRMAERVDELEAAVEAIAELQPRMVATLQRHGVVFDGPLGADPKNFQHVAFSVYTTLCEADSFARAVLRPPTPEGGAEVSDEAEWCPYFCEVYDGGSPDGQLCYCERPKGHDDQHYHREAWLSDSGWELDAGMYSYAS